jgi:imidazolonepropionase-like amidohydrolase
MKILAVVCLATAAAAAPPDSLRVTTPRVVLAHVEVIDGTGSAPQLDRNVVIDGGKIAAITAGADQPPAGGTTVLDLRGYTVMPGIVGMHDHLWYLRSNPSGSVEMSWSAPRLYLANGVTTIRTAGSIAPYNDLRLKQAIDSGAVPGPHMDVTGPYLEGASSSTNLQQYHLTGADDARQTVAYWADRGATSFKAYAHITRDELRAAIDEAHKRGLKVTGHLCSVTYEEAIELGIDNLEHGFFENTALAPDRKPDVCTPGGGDATLEQLTPDSAEAKRLIALLVARHVAVTSTLPNAAASALTGGSRDGRPLLRAEALEAMSPAAREAYLEWRNRAPNPKAAMLLRRDMDLERAFVAAGGLLLAGCDAVGAGGNVPGFADQRELELLVDAGFTPVEAIRIATLNGATFLGRADRIGSIAIGKNADLVVVKGDPAARINDIENVEIVFKDGLGYDTRKLLDAVKGRYGDY